MVRNCRRYASTGEGPASRSTTGLIDSLRCARRQDFARSRSIRDSKSRLLQAGRKFPVPLQ
jgi:hypothetical protein